MPPVPVIPYNPSGSIKGYFSWNWGKGSYGQICANTGIAFTGIVSIPDDIAQYTSGCYGGCPPLAGTRWLSLGGGSSAGTFTAAVLNSIVSDMS